MCRKQTEEHKAKIKASRKRNDELLNRKYKSWNKGQKGLQEAWNKGKTFEEMYGEQAEVVKQKISESVKNNLPSEEIRKEKGKKAGEKIKQIRTGKTLEEIYGEERAKEIKQKQKESHIGKSTCQTEKRIEGYQKMMQTKSNNPNSIKGGKAKYYDTPIGKVQGTYELRFIENIINENKQLPIKPNGIKTPDGYYFPDFEFQDKFVEIKSPFTYKIFCGDIEGMDGTKSVTQLNKAKWCSQNIKPVEVIILNKTGEIFQSIIL
jgi:hypothetical protein